VSRQRPPGLGRLDLPPVWAAGAAALAWALAEWVPLARLGDLRAVGAGLFLAGTALMAWSALWFLKKRTPIEPHETPRALIVEGPYRINRNPIYTGMILGVLGIALWFGALSALVPAAALPVFLTRRFVIPEEAALERAFKDEARRYFAGTRRW
jgi:protein-S-isoprenylcysteine O-methyltransferase Ste14